MRHGHVARIAFGAAIALAGAVVAQAGQRPYATDSKRAADRECLARAMYFESIKTAEDGMLAVGTVVLNRLKSGRYGSSICGIVGQHRQFAPGVLSRRMEGKPAQRARQVADAVLKGQRHPRARDAMFFHAAGLRFKYSNMHYVLVSGGNAFYEKRGARSASAARANAVSMARAIANSKADQAAAAPVVLAALERPASKDDAPFPPVRPAVVSPSMAVADAWSGVTAYRSREPAPAPDSALAAVASLHLGPARPADRQQIRVVSPAAPVQAAMVPVSPAPSPTLIKTVSQKANMLVAQAWASVTGR